MRTIKDYIKQAQEACGDLDIPEDALTVVGLAELEDWQRECDLLRAAVDNVTQLGNQLLRSDETKDIGYKILDAIGANNGG